MSDYINMWIVNSVVCMHVITFKVEIETLLLMKYATASTKFVTANLLKN